MKFWMKNFVLDFDIVSVKVSIHFFDLIEMGKESDSNIEHAISVLKLTQGVLG